MPARFGHIPPVYPVPGVAAAGLEAFAEYFVHFWHAYILSIIYQHESAIDIAYMFIVRVINTSNVWSWLMARSYHL